MVIFNGRNYMKIYGIYFIVAIIILFSCLDAYSFTDGNRLKVLCKSSDSFEIGMCYGIVSASMYVASSELFCEKKIKGHDLLKISSYKECKDQFQVDFPSQMKVKQGVDIVVKFMEDHPERLHIPSTALCKEAFSTIFKFRKISDQ